MSSNNIVAFVYPPDARGFQNRLFQFGDSPAETHDGRMIPFRYLWKAARAAGIELYSADLFLNGTVQSEQAAFYFFGDWPYAPLLEKPGILLGSYYSFEPPIYGRPDDRFHRLPETARAFRRVYTLPTCDGIRKFVPSLPEGLPVHKYYFPQAYDGVLEPLWRQSNRRFMVCINAPHQSPLWRAELYSERVRAIRYFGARNLLDLFGKGWEKRARPLRSAISYVRQRPRGALSWVRGRLQTGLWRSDFVYLSAANAIRRSYRGVAEDKRQTLAQYTFAICYESMSVEGYVTEKIFDCLAVGTIPIYLGPPDMDKYVPRECYIDRRGFQTYEELHTYLRSLTLSQINNYREAGRDYFKSEMYHPFSKQQFAERFIRDLMEDAAVVLDDL